MHAGSSLHTPPPPTAPPPTATPPTATPVGSLPTAAPNPLPSMPPPPLPSARAANQSRIAPRASLSRRQQAGYLARLVACAIGVVAAFQIDDGIFVAIALIFVLVVPMEKLYPRQRGQRLRRPMLSTDLAFALLSPLLNVASVAALIVIGGLSLFWLPGLLLRPAIGALPAAVVPIVAFLLFDFIGYWAHRWAHEVPFLWRFHAVHHSPEHMDWISGFRVHPFDGVLIAPGAFFLLGAGFDAELTGVLAVVQIALGIFFHANVRVRWRVLDRLVSNPEFHHWHHANEADSIGHNYGAALPWWDQVFGTFFMPSRSSERRPTHYGVDEYLPRTMAGLLTYPLRGARAQARLLRRPIKAVKMLFSAIRQLLIDVRGSTFRATHSVRQPTTVGCSSTNASLFADSSVRPGWDPHVSETAQLEARAASWSTPGVVEF